MTQALFSWPRLAKGESQVQHLCENLRSIGLYYGAAKNKKRPAIADLESDRNPVKKLTIENSRD
jgi:hypothetical protein